MTATAAQKIPNNMVIHSPGEMLRLVLKVAVCTIAVLSGEQPRMIMARDNGS